MKLTRFYIPFVIVSVVGFSMMLYSFINAQGGSTNDAFIRIGAVYENFEMTKELNGKYDAVKNTRQLILDSLMLNLSLVEKQLGKTPSDKFLIERYYLLKNRYLQKEEEFNTSNQLLSGKYNEQIMNQMNQYIKDYGKQKNFRFIYGANGDGAIMYARENLDVTVEVTEYMNLVYQGKSQ